MPANHLEQLVAEWYEYRGYFVRRNVRVGKRPKGGWDCELDVVAFHPIARHLVHVEPSGDAESWAQREVRFKKKFEAGRTHIPGLFAGLNIPSEIEQVALLTMASLKNRNTIGGVKIVLLGEFLREVRNAFTPESFTHASVNESMPLLRMVQMLNAYP